LFCQTKSFNGIDIDVIISMIGSVLVVGTITSYIFENISKERLFAEIFSQINKDMSVKKAGLDSCHPVSTDIVFRDDICRARQITTLFAYSADFIKRHVQELTDAARRGVEIRFVFVKRESTVLDAMRALGWSEASITANYEALERYRASFSEYKNVRFVFVDAIPRYGAVLFDDTVYVIEHTTSSGQRNVPALKLSKGGFLADFYCADIEKLIHEGK
jgi:hypothetical protein